MSEAMMKRLTDMLQTVERNEATVERRMADAGFDQDPLLVLSMSKYFDALEKLAAE